MLRFIIEILDRRVINNSLLLFLSAIYVCRTNKSRIKIVTYLQEPVAVGTKHLVKLNDELIHQTIAIRIDPYKGYKPW